MLVLSRGSLEKRLRAPIEVTKADDTSLDPSVFSALQGCLTHPADTALIQRHGGRGTTALASSQRRHGVTAVPRGSAAGHGSLLTEDSLDVPGM